MKNRGDGGEVLLWIDRLKLKTCIASTFRL